MEQPSLRTLANCIEKTAEFICAQGAQMEILMRAKETENPKFQFLNPGNPYHAIYKQVLEKKRSRSLHKKTLIKISTVLMVFNYWQNIKTTLKTFLKLF